MNVRSVLSNAGSALIVSLAVAGCSQTGDFGRSAATSSSPYLLTQASATGTEQQFLQTDEEREMEARIHRFLTLPRNEPWLSRLFAARDEEAVVSDYYDGLKAQGFASSRGPYNRLRTDIQIDLASLPATFAAICQVQEIDRRRRLAVDSLVNVEPDLYAAATARMQENRNTIAQFKDALNFRYDSYVFALEHLIVETPHEQARTVDTELSGLATANGAAQANDYCIHPRNEAHNSATRLGAI